MAITLTINGTSYPFPTSGDSPPWGNDVTNAVSAIVAVLNTLNGSEDILTTSFTIENNKAVATTVTGLAFDTSTVRGAVIRYSIYRSSTTPTELSETGTMYLAYKSTANTWEVSQVCVGSSGVTFTITTAGQVQYISTDIGSGSYVGKLKFNAIAFVQV